MSRSRSLKMIHGLRPGPLGHQGDQHQDLGQNDPRSSRQRRREKRAAARNTAENVEMSEKTVRSPSKPEHENVCETSNPKCDLCNFTITANNGVSVHKGHMLKDKEIF